ncbi:MAG: nicotianamine synthase [Alphaproteobacteria bacterium]|nr:nicotianamine synthase [Alphaproteobacteria bacterium]
MPTGSVATPDHPEVAAFISLIRQTYESLGREVDLSPANERVNSLLRTFVDAVLHVSSVHATASILENPDVRNIRKPMLEKLSHAEYLMERYFAQQFGAQCPLTASDLDQFWYRTCYRNLVDAEVTAMASVLRSGSALSGKIAFVGSGPLPLTAIDMHFATGADVLCIDSDADAVRLSRQMIANMGLQHKIGVHRHAGETFDYAGCDVVMVASLVPEKDSVVRRIQATAPDAAIGVRSVRGLKALLYEPVNEHAFDDLGLRHVSSSKDSSETINTTHFLRPAPYGATLPPGKAAATSGARTPTPSPEALPA